METVFKVGMEVYDQVNYPNKKGKVVDTEPAVDGDDYPIEVEFEDSISEIYEENASEIFLKVKKRNSTRRIIQTCLNICHINQE